MKQFNQQASQYDNYSGIQKVLNCQLLDLLANKNYKNIIDLGCGTGYLTKKLLLKYPQAQVTTLDQSAQMLAIIKENDSHINTINENIENFSTDIKYDLIIANFSFQWLANPIAEIKRYSQFLTSNGTLLISLPYNKSFSELQKSYQECNISNPHLPLIDFYSLTQALDDSIFQLNLCQINDYYTSTQDFYRSLHGIGAIKALNQIKASQFHQLIKYHNSKYSSLIPFDYHYIVISA